MTDTQFNKDLYAKAIFPMQLFDGIFFRNGTVIREIDSAADFGLLMAQLVNQIESPQDINQRKLSLDTRLEKELVLLTHLIDTSKTLYFGIQHNLANSRQERAYQQCLYSERKAHKKEIQSIPYHVLAFLYYTLMHGQSTLGHYDTAERSYVSALRELRNQGISSPRVLLLGFSSIYSLENLAAMLHLVGFKQSNILAIDKMAHPLNAGKSYYGNKLFNSTITYIQQDILADQLEDRIAETQFDLIATHLFFTHFPDAQKKLVWKKISQLLSPNGIFADEEIFVNGRINRQAYNDYFRTLTNDYKPDATDPSTLLNISDYLYQFGSAGPFNPYYSISYVSYDAQKEAGLRIQMPFLSTRNIWAAGGGVVTADMHAIHARK
ncbi:class I SAM-dependent methyltransferase [Candidatus Woesearchaeota archaeon]|nr:class I SAM-dependent methyltransferase [Candidatus Woesearchaeota archaeon]